MGGVGPVAAGSRGPHGSWCRWDFAEGENFLAWMQQASAGSRCTLAVLSADYVASRYAMEELWAAHATQRLLPVRVRDVDLDGLLRAVVHRDLVGLKEEAAREQVLAAIARAFDGKPRVKPNVQPWFLGGPQVSGERGSSVLARAEAG